MDLNTISKNYPTPFYWYDLGLLRRTLEACQKSSNELGYQVHYAMKANFNPKILEEIKRFGFGVDCVSGGEIRLALETGFHPKDLVFAGVGKTDEEIIFALEKEIFCFNVESFQELEIIEELARGLDKKASIALRINPNIDAGTHHYITTGLSENKFGIPSSSFGDVFSLLRKAKHLNFIGLHFHIGSLIQDMEVFKNLCLKVNHLIQVFENEGLYIQILNLGGGLGIDYYEPELNPIPNFESYFQVFNRFLEIKPHQKLHFELGRSLVGQSGNLITRVTYLKKGIQTSFLIVDAGMNNLLRPSLYQAYHHVENLTKAGFDGPKETYDLVGPICESGDFFRKSLNLPETERGDLLKIHSAGAYGEVMSSNYNLRGLAPSYYSE